MQEPLVKNAADEPQVKKAGDKMKLKEKIELDDLRFVLKNIEGRRVMWRLLEQCKVFETIWENSARIHYNAGKQDIGHYIMSEVVRANEDAFLLMMKENKEI